MPPTTTHLDNDEVNVIVYEDLEPFPQLLMDFFFALAIPISTGYSLHISTYLLYLLSIHLYEAVCTMPPATMVPHLSAAARAMLQLAVLMSRHCTAHSHPPHPLH